MTSKLRINDALTMSKDPVHAPPINSEGRNGGSPDRSFAPSLDRSIARPLCRSFDRSMLDRSLNRLLDRSLDSSLAPSLARSLARSFARLLTRLLILQHLENRPDTPQTLHNPECQHGEWASLKPPRNPMLILCLLVLIWCLFCVY